MHELGLTMGIVDVALERAEGRRVRRVRVAIGKLAAVMPDSIHFCFDLCTKGTDLEGAVLEIDDVPGRARCRACDGEVALTRPWGRCACGSQDLEQLSGHEVSVIEMEVA